MTESMLAPKRFFSVMVQGKPSPTSGFLVAATALLIMTLAKQVAMRAVPGASEFSFHVPVWIIAPSAGFFGALILWGGLTFGLSMVVGDSARTAQLVGWAFAPLVAIGFLEALIAAWWPVSVHAPPRPEDPIQVFLWWAQVQTLAQKAPTFQVFAALEFIAVLWGAYLLWVALKVWRPHKAVVGAAVFGTFMLGFWLLRNLPSLGWV